MDLPISCKEMNNSITSACVHSFQRTLTGAHARSSPEQVLAAGLHVHTRSRKLPLSRMHSRSVCHYAHTCMHFCMRSSSTSCSSSESGASIVDSVIIIGDEEASMFGVKVRASIHQRGERGLLPIQGKQACGMNPTLGSQVAVGGVSRLSL